MTTVHERLRYSMKDITLDLPLLRKTMEWVTAQHELALAGKPSAWDQQKWTQHIPRSEQELMMNPECGTVCCVAGYISLLDSNAFLVQGGCAHVPLLAESLGMSEEDFKVEFYDLIDLENEVAVNDYASRKLGFENCNKFHAACSLVGERNMFMGDNTYEDVIRIANELALKYAGEPL